MGIRKVSNPPNPYSDRYTEWIDCEPQSELEVFEETARSILSENKSPDLPFRYSVNPYRGCFHGCIYCYARPTHQYLDFGAGTDFETKLVVKRNAATLLRQAFMRPNWCGDLIVFSGVTDCYQPLELSYQLTKQCLEVCHSFKNPVCIVTKGALIVRDTELLSDLHAEAHVEVFISIPCLDNDIAKAIEPYAPRPAVRLRAMKKLSEAGVPVGVAIAPIIPGLTDSHIAKVLESAHSAGARSAFMTMLRLPREVKPVFLDNAKRLFPTKFTKISNALREARDGELNTTKFGARMRGEGARWSAIEQLFRVTTERLGYRRSEETVPNNRNTFQRPNQQLSLSLS